MLLVQVCMRPRTITSAWVVRNTKCIEVVLAAKRKKPMASRVLLVRSIWFPRIACVQVAEAVPCRGAGREDPPI